MREFDCPCCMCVKLDPAVLIKLQAIRNEVRRPIYILSGYRCPSYNARIGGARNSYHMRGQAADFVIYGYSVDQLRQLALKHGFTGIGRYYRGGFLHADTGPRREWTG